MAKKKRRTAKTAKPRGNTQVAAPDSFPARARPPLPPELAGELPPGGDFADLPDGARFRYRAAVERGLNEVWEKRGETHYALHGADNAFPVPEGVLVLPA
jgi:hypothetical protein